jgi:hypothetical protein
VKRPPRPRHILIEQWVSTSPIIEQWVSMSPIIQSTAGGSTFKTDPPKYHRPRPQCSLAAASLVMTTSHNDYSNQIPGFALSNSHRRREVHGDKATLPGRESMRDGWGVLTGDNLAFKP